MSERPIPARARSQESKDDGGPAVPPPARAAFAKAGAPLLVSAGVHIKGNLACDQRLQIDGHVEGDVSADNVTVGPTGAVIGSLSARQVWIEGAVTGRIRADSVTITESGKVEADIAQNSLCILPGASFQGTCRRIDRGPKT